MICFKNGGRATLFFAFCIITILHYWYIYYCKKENFDSSASEESIENVASLYDEGLIELDNLVVTGKLTVGGEVICDGSGTFGNAKIGNWDKDSNYVSFSHKNRTGDNYGILQNDKNTYVNSTADGNVFIRNNNVPKMSVSSNGIRFDDNLGIELRSLYVYKRSAPIDTGYPVDKWVCTIGDYRGKGMLHKYFFQRKGSNNWWLSFCESYNPDKDSDPQGDKSTTGSSNCPSSSDWRFIRILAIPRILFDNVESIKTT
jgi:hypothetical protein